MKKTAIIVSLFLVFSVQLFAQKTNPDTLIIGTKNGQILLISDSLQKFNEVKADELIKQALHSVRDSLPVQIVQKQKFVGPPLSTIVFKKGNFKLWPVFALGLVRDKVSPAVGVALDFATQRKDYLSSSFPEYSFINVALSSYFTFEYTPLGYHTRNNFFLEASVGNRMNNAINNYGNFSELNLGLGYLVHREGPYFTPDTFKIFLNVGIKNSFFKIRPEIYFTDHLRKAFPSLTVKIF